MKWTERFRSLPVGIALSLATQGLAAQEFVNGNFENNTGVFTNDYLFLLAPEFEAMVPHCYSSGTIPNIDLISRFGRLVPQGEDWYLGLTPEDLLTLELTEALVPGDTYTVTFYDQCREIAFPVEVGLSQDPHAFGDPVYATPQGALLGIWSERTFMFVAPNDGRYISVRQQAGNDPRAWVGIDYFVMESRNCHRTVDAGPDRVLCPGQSLQLTAAGSVFDSFVWDDQSTAQSRVVTTPGTYWVVGTKGICSDSDTVVIASGEIPETDFEADRTAGCAPLEVVFAYTGHTQPGDTYAWTAGDGTAPVTGASFMHVYTEAQCHGVSLAVTNAQGCTAIRALPDYVCVQPDPEAAFTYLPGPVFVDQPQVHFFNASTGHVGSEWQFGDGVVSVDEHPQHTYAVGQGGAYPVRLVVTSDAGCTDTAWDTVTVIYPFALFVPDAFTPDGDAHNPVFIPTVAAPFDVDAYRLEIYDRWGTPLFSTTELSHGWDGTVHGQTAPGGTYVWQVSVRDPYTHRPMVRTGHVVLVK